jgi:retinoblastoma-associated protein
MKQPVTGQQAATPVRSAMTSIQHLASLLQLCSDGPSVTLLGYMERCSINPMPAVKERLAQLEELFVHHFMLATGDRSSSIARVRYSLTTRLYYRIMEALLKMEEERLGQQDFSRLLNKPVFHKSLIACSAEVVLVTYEAHTGSTIQSPSVPRLDATNLLFPWILRVFDVNAFDFLKVLESFVRAEPKLATEVITHLSGVENQILEQLAWQNASPVFELLKNYDGPRQPITPSKDASMSLQQENSPSSWLDRSNPADTSAMFESPNVSLRRSHSLNLFLNKVFRLAYQRLQHLCGLLDVCGDLIHKIWTCFEFCVTRRPDLLHDRHLDQIVMCCIYAICKVADREIKFKSIVSMYRVMPNTCQQVYKNVFISSGEYDSIISFYNRIFMQSLKTFILQFGSNTMPSATQSPAPKPVITSPLQMSPKYQLPGRQNFYISPMKNSPFKQPLSPSCMTPRSRQLYSFGEGPLAAEKLRAINERMRFAAASSAGSRTSKCLKFDQIEAPVPVTSGVVSADPSESLKHKTPASRKSLSFDNANPSTQ